MGFFSLPQAESLEMLQREHKQVMSDLQKLPIEISEALNKCKWLIEENESYMYVPDAAWEGLILPSFCSTQSEALVLACLPLSKQPACGPWTCDSWTPFCHV